jgi:HEAT repeat protein
MVAANHPHSQEQSIPLLIKILDEAFDRDNSLIIGMAIECLGQAHHPLAVRALIQKRPDRYVGTRRSALARSGDIALPILLDMATQEPFEQRQYDFLVMAADICRRNPAIVPYAAQWLTPRILNHQAEPLWAYGKFIRWAHPTQLIEPMVAIAGDPAADIDARLYATRILRYIADPRTIGLMLELIKGENRRLCYLAMCGLSEIKTSCAAPHIIKLIRSPDVRMRRLGLTIAGWRRLRSAIPAIRETLADGQAATRRLAVIALARAQDSSVIPILCERIEDRARPVRMAVVEALERVYQRFPEHQQAIIAALRTASNDPDEQIRRAAELTLHHLGASLEAS